MNTGLGIGKLPSKGWVAFRDFIRRSPDVDVGALLQRGTPLTQDEVEAYRAPFQGSETKAGVRRFPVGLFEEILSFANITQATRSCPSKDARSSRKHISFGILPKSTEHRIRVQ